MKLKICIIINRLKYLSMYRRFNCYFAALILCGVRGNEKRAFLTFLSVILADLRKKISDKKITFEFLF